MFPDYTQTSKDECFQSVLKLVKMNVSDYTKTTKDECLLSLLKLVKVNVCWVY